MYRASQELYTRATLCCLLLWFGIGRFTRIHRDYPSASEVTMTNMGMRTTWTDYIATAKQNTSSHRTYVIHDSNVHGANMGPIWGRQDPGGPHVGPMNIAISDGIYCTCCCSIWPDWLPHHTMYLYTGYIGSCSCVRICREQIRLQVIRSTIQQSIVLHYPAL